MGKVLLIGDMHLKISNFQLAKDFLSWLNKTIEDQKPDIIVNLGDCFDSHAVVRSEIMTEFYSHIKYSLRHASKYYYIVGNHDCARPNSLQYHALKGMQDIDNFIVIDKPTDIDNMTLVPYIYDFKEFPLDTKEVCIAHQTFIGADYGYYRPDVGVDADKLKAEIIISGHVHKKQEFGKVFYPGTPYAHSADDVGQIKGISVFDTASYKFTFIESPMPNWRKMSFNVTPDLSISTIHDAILNDINNKDHWIINIVGPKAEIIAYLDSPEWTELAKTYSVRIKPEYNDKEKTKKVSIKSNTIDDILNDYVDKIYKGAIDKDSIKTKIQETLKSVRSN